VDHVEQNPRPLHPVIREFQILIEQDQALYMLFHEMFDQIPKQDAYYRDPFGSSQVRDYKHMLKLFNEMLTRAPIFNDNELIGMPINAILDWPMGTPSGIAAFLNEKVNAQIKHMLDVWSYFLTSKNSAYVLNESQTGWLGPPAQAAMRASTSSKRQPKWTFELTFICTPDAPHFGYKSWDDFFTRRFKPGVRPVASPGDDNVIINACESAPYRIYRNLKRLDKFWIKGQPYSLTHMLAHDPLVHHFVGGTIYQSFLDPANYHRWHSPVSGTIVKAFVQPGTYYSENLVYGFPVSEIRTAKHSRNTSTASSFKAPRHLPRPLPDSSVPFSSQSYHVAVATRALIFIRALNPAIGLICVLPVGMAEVSTCEITVQEGQVVRKGDELGMFHFGGSTCCLIFRPGVELKFDMHGQTEIGLESRNIQVNARIATVVRREKAREKVVVRKKVHSTARVRGDEKVVGWRGEAFKM
jgi:phosphatidylserine decarboxylase